MRKGTPIRILAAVLCLCMLFSACRQKQPENTQTTTSPENTQSTTAPEAASVTYSIQLQTEGGMALEKIGVYVYTDASMTELVWFDRTDASGLMTFTDAASDSYVAVLNGVPEEYAVEEQYLLTGELTTIVLAPKESQEQSLADIRYTLGSIVQDFTVVDTEGTEHTLSELLKTKQAVVLNFFYNECAPCRQEFPYLQEAYTQYADKVAVIGMNPVNQDPAAIDALKEELGVSFPMAACDPDWALAMQIVGYPTTVIIDRYGSIALIHMGSIPDAKTFKDAFAFFAAEDYVQTTVEDIASLVTDEPDNPVDISGQSSVELTIRPGETLSYDVYKLNDVIMQVKGEGAQVGYQGKTYDAKDGVVSLTVSCPDNYTPVRIDFTNTGTETTTYQVTFSSKAGSWENPYSLSLGEFTTKVYSGNDKGVYYRYTAKEDGFLKLTCMDVTEGVEYSYVVYNLSSYVYLTSEYDGQTDEEGHLILSMKVEKGDSVRIALSTLPDENNNYPGATFLTLAEFTKGDAEEDQEELPKVTYTITVTDGEGNPVSGVPVKVTGEAFSEVWTTDENGVAQKELDAGTYTAVVTVPADYTCENASFTLTQENASANAVLNAVVITNADYTVTVLDPNGTPVAGAMVIIGDIFGTTDQNGKFVTNLTVGSYEVYISGVPEDLITEAASYRFPEDAFELVITLSYKPGSEFAPIEIGEMPFDTGVLRAGEGLYYILPLEEGKLLTVRDADAYVTYEGVTYGAVNGVVSVPVQTAANAVVIIGNGGGKEESYTVYLLDSVGTQDNPQPVNSIEALEAILESGQAEYYYAWTAPGAGTVEFTLEGLTEGIHGELIIVNSTTGEQIVIRTKDDVSDEPIPEETVPEETIPEETIPEEIVPEETVPEESVPEETIPEETIPEETIPEETIPEETIPEETVPEETVPEETVPEETVPEETVPEETVPEETVPEETVPEETVPEETVPEETVPEETVPEETAPEETVPGEEPKPITVSKGDVIVLCVRVITDDEGQIPAASFRVTGTFCEEPEEDPELPEDPEETSALYTITVTDYMRTPAANTMLAIYDGDGALISTAATDETGVLSLTLTRGDYTVRLLGSDLYYEKTTAVLTAGKTELLILLAQEPDPENLDYMFAADGEYAYSVSEGGTHVIPGEGQMGYSTEYGVTFYAFAPERAGIYRITTSNPDAKIGFWNSTSFIFDMTTSLEDYADNAFTRTVQEANLGVSYVLGISGSTECALEITWLGEPGFDPDYVAYTQYEGSWEPVKFTYTGGTLTDVDVVNGTAADYVLVFNETDGFYHLGTEDGPSVYVRLSGTGLKISLDLMLNGDGVAGGTAFRAMYYDEYGVLHKEDYSALTMKYIDAMNTGTTVYPLTKDLYNMLSRGVVFHGWINPENGNYLFEDKEVNQTIGWMFLLCYEE